MGLRVGGREKENGKRINNTKIHIICVVDDITKFNKTC
jgi:hypothetical protein